MGGLFSGTKRTEILQSLMDHPVDILIIGGGITGAGIALDAVSRGFSVGLVEMQDFAAGTSSRSTKLIHGGLRYLQQYEIALVKEIGREREIVYELGPHVTSPETMLLPIYQDGSMGRLAVSLGLKLYDYLAGVRKAERHKMLSAAETLQLLPMLSKDKLLGAGRYVEYRTDDARLTIEVLKEAVYRGAKAVNYAKVTAFIYDDHNSIQAVQVQDVLSKQVYLLEAGTYINATGPWLDTVRSLDQPVQGKCLQLSKGIHIVLDRSALPLAHAVYFDAPDQRMIFAIPRDQKIYLGTTDTAASGIDIDPRVTEAEQTYLLAAVMRIFPKIKLCKSDIESCYAGFRPLIGEVGKGTAGLSRHDEIWLAPSGLMSIAGGKLTGYRKMAERIVDQLVHASKRTDLAHSRCQTKRLPISGGLFGGSKQFETYVSAQIKNGIALGLTGSEAEMLARLFGSNVEKVYRYKGAAEHLEQSKMSIAENMMLLYCLEEEMVISPVDFLRRRTGRLLFDAPWVLRVKEDIFKTMSAHYAWSTELENWFRLQLYKEIEIVTEALSAD